jgi:hypothetical protein
MTTRSSLRSLRIVATLTALVGLLAVGATPVLAKEGMEAQLTTPVRLDTPPGTTLTVAWTILVEGEDGRVPVTGMPVFLRFVPPGGGKAVEAMGDERPANSGRFMATLVVPAGGIARVEVGMHNEMCENGSCTRSDMLFDLTDDSLVSGTAAGLGAAAAPIASAAYTPVQPATVPAATTSPAADATDPRLASVGLGLAVAIVAALGITLGIRSRRARRVATTTLVTLGIGLLGSIAVAGLASAKEPAVATLDPGVPTDAAPGTSILVGWTMTVQTPDGLDPYQADQILLQVVARDGASSTVDASRDGGGPYVATVVVPASGIGALHAQLPSDGPSPLTFDLWSGRPLVQTAGGMAEETAGADPAATPAGVDLGPVFVLGVAVAVSAALGGGLWLASRRRSARNGPEVTRTESLGGS